MTAKPPRRVPVEAAATPGEIAEAIEALTKVDWARLKRSAKDFISKLGPKADYRTVEDLMQTALRDLLADTRRWNKSNVDFVKFLTEAMRSISSNWARSYKKDETLILESDLRRENEEGDVFNPLEKVQGHTPNPDKQLSDRQILEQIGDLFRDDQRAQMVLEAWQEGYDPTGVRDLWELSQNEYNTIVRRIRRRLIAAGITPD
ncbi:MAG: hypothetical protein RIG61_01075 [Deltaproteobacteria bacterium]